MDLRLVTPSEYKPLIKKILLEVIIFDNEGQLHIFSLKRPEM